MYHLYLLKYLLGLNPLDLNHGPLLSEYFTYHLLHLLNYTVLIAHLDPYIRVPSGILADQYLHLGLQAPTVLKLDPHRAPLLLT